MRRHDELLLRTAVQALKADAPDAEQVAAAAQRVASRLAIHGVSDPVISVIDNCGDVQQLLAAYRAGTLSQARRLLIEDHLRDCGACLRQFRSGSGTAVLDWSAPRATHALVWPSQAFGLAVAACFALLVCSFFAYKDYWQTPPGVQAQVQSIDGSAYGISDTGDRQLSAGDPLKAGEQVRTSGGAHAVLRLRDGSMVEVKERSVLGVDARGHNMTVSLGSGAVIVEAAKRDRGHLYVKTPDCRVAVTGTVFSVNSGIKGSRVAVLQGSVQVMHAGMDTLVHAGDQMSTNDNLSPVPVEQQISWSQDRDKYLLLLAQFGAMKHRLEQIPFPQPRYSSDLLQRVPGDTLLYISIPNLGEFLSEANQIFDDQLKQSPALQQWWDRGHGGNTAELDSLIDKLHQASEYLGHEIVIVGTKQSDTPGFAILADVEKGGLDDFLRKQFAASTGLILLDEKSLEDSPSSPPTKSGGYALIRQREAVFSNSIARLKEINAQLNAGASGFAAGEFGQQIATAYDRGAGVILAADLHQMVSDKLSSLRAGGKSTEAIENSGMDDVRYLIAEHRETNGLPENHLDLQFSGTRQHIASWLATPAPIGSLDFVTPNAAIAVALLSKDPTVIADDLMTIAAADKGTQTKWAEAEAKLRISFRDDLAANLGGDFLWSLDGPILPTPSWKAVIEVHDPERLEKTLERLTESLREQAQGAESHSFAIESSEIGGQRFYSVRTSGSIVAQYIFANGYMIVAPNRALLMEALETHASGDSLARSAAFKALLPKDENENYSAIEYQNLRPVLTPLLAQFSGESAAAIRQLAADARPTAICAWGRDSRIEAASNSHLFGFDFLTLGALTSRGNKHLAPSVRE